MVCLCPAYAVARCGVYATDSCDPPWSQMLPSVGSSVVPSLAICRGSRSKLSASIRIVAGGLILCESCGRPPVNELVPSRGAGCCRLSSKGAVVRGCTLGRGTIELNPPPQCCRGTNPRLPQPPGVASLPSFLERSLVGQPGREVPCRTVRPREEAPCWSRSPTLWPRSVQGGNAQSLGGRADCSPPNPLRPVGLRCSRSPKGTHCLRCRRLRGGSLRASGPTQAFAPIPRRLRPCVS